MERVPFNTTTALSAYIWSAPTRMPAAAAAAWFTRNMEPLVGWSTRSSPSAVGAIVVGSHVQVPRATLAWLRTKPMMCAIESRLSTSTLVKPHLFTGMDLDSHPRAASATSVSAKRRGTWRRAKGLVCTLAFALLRASPTHDLMARGALSDIQKRTGCSAPWRSDGTAVFTRFEQIEAMRAYWAPGSVGPGGVRGEPGAEPEPLRVTVLCVAIFDSFVRAPYPHTPLACRTHTSAHSRLPPRR
jgi:hypothetical protein